MSRTTSPRQITSASTSAPMAAQTVGRLTNGLPGGRSRACGLKSFWNQAWCCRAAPAPSLSCRDIDGQSRPTSLDLGRILRPRQPDFLATGAPDGTACRAQVGQIDGIGRCTMGANDVHGANLHNELAEMLQGDR